MTHRRHLIRASGWIAGVVAVAALMVPTGAAAATRAEYVAQVDPMCQAGRGPIDQSTKAYIRNAKRFEFLYKWGSWRAMARQAKRTGRIMRSTGQLEWDLFNRIAQVPPPEGDAEAVHKWIDARIQNDAVWVATGTALIRLKFRLYGRGLVRADKTWNVSKALFPAYLGFQQCW